MLKPETSFPIQHRYCSLHATFMTGSAVVVSLIVLSRFHPATVKKTWPELYRTSSVFYDFSKVPQKPMENDDRLLLIISTSLLMACIVTSFIALVTLGLHNTSKLMSEFRISETRLLDCLKSLVKNQWENRYLITNIRCAHCGQLGSATNLKDMLEVRLSKLEKIAAIIKTSVENITDQLGYMNHSSPVYHQVTGSSLVFPPHSERTPVLGFMPTSSSNPNHPPVIHSKPGPWVPRSSDLNLQNINGKYAEVSADEPPQGLDQKTGIRHCVSPQNTEISKPSRAHQQATSRDKPTALEKKSMT